MQISVVGESESDGEKGKDQNLSFSIEDCKAETVVIYLDRAEVCRSLECDVKKGENEVILTNISTCVDKDSIRYATRARPRDSGHAPFVQNVLQVLYILAVIGGCGLWDYGYFVILVRKLLNV